MEESIYNLLPPTPSLSPRRPIYRSKYPPHIPPTGSTFAHHTTSRPPVSNLSGEFSYGLQAHTHMGNRSTMGYLQHDRKHSPQHFQRKQTGTMGNNSLPPIRSFTYDCAHKRASVPKLHEKPLLGLKSNRDFIMHNAVEAILSTPRMKQQPVDWLEKKNFGKVPAYLQRIKSSLHDEYRMLRSLQDNEQEQKLLSSEEVEELKNGLKHKWDEVNRKYQKMTHLRLIDTTGLKRRKEDYEAQLKQIEDDIKVLNKAYIFVK